MRFLTRELICMLVFLPFIFSCENMGGTDENVGGTDEIVRVTGVSISEKELIMEVGDVVRLTATVHPSNASNQEVIWTSTNTSAVSITNNGLLTAYNPGRSTVSVITVDGEYTDTCDIEVIAKSWPISQLTLSHSSLSLYEGSDFILEVEIQPVEAAGAELIWESSVEYVATVDNGHITAHNEGETIISVSTMDGSKYAECKVNVKKVGGSGDSIDEEEGIW